jgi:hypothetical protein
VVPRRQPRQLLEHLHERCRPAPRNAQDLDRPRHRQRPDLRRAPAREVDREHLVLVARLVERERERRARVPDRVAPDPLRAVDMPERDVVDVVRKQPQRRRLLAPDRHPPLAQELRIGAGHIEVARDDQCLIRPPPLARRGHHVAIDPRERIVEVGRRIDRPQERYRRDQPAPPSDRNQDPVEIQRTLPGARQAADHVHAELAQHRRRRPQLRRRIVVPRDRDHIHRRPGPPQCRKKIEPHSLRRGRRRRAVEHIAGDHQRIRRLSPTHPEQPAQERLVLVLARDLAPERMPQMPVGRVDDPHRTVEGDRGV